MLGGGEANCFAVRIDHVMREISMVYVHPQFLHPLLSASVECLVQRMEGKLARSLVQLSEDLYGAPGHFLLELIQNADDNRYAVEQSNDPEQLPTLEFCAAMHNRTSTSVDPCSALLIMNNESVGFTEMDITSLCDVGVSTKTEDRDSKTGVCNTQS